MTLRTLFDDNRRRELRHAIRKGERIRFGGKDTGPDGIIGPDAASGREKLEDYLFLFKGQAEDGRVMLDVMQGDEKMGEGACVIGQPNRIRLKDGKEITISPGNPYAEPARGRSGK